MLCFSFFSFAVGSAEYFVVSSGFSLGLVHTGVRLTSCWSSSVRLMSKLLSGGKSFKLRRAMWCVSSF